MPRKRRRTRTRKANREYKDRLFIKIFENKEDLLSLYNAVNGSNYQNLEDLEVTTLNNAIYMRMKNDVSFLVDGFMNLYEHQSTYNPNMPLRDCLYMLQLYQNYIDSRNLDLYSSMLLKIPTPRLIVFYNGQDRMRREEERILKLSDAFEKPDLEPSLEFRVRMININHGKNQEIVEKCPKLYEYSYLVAKIREYQSTGMTLEGAIGAAIEDCLVHGYLVELLTSNRREVFGMLLYEYDEKKHLKNLYEEGVAEGKRRGERMGERRGIKKGFRQKEYKTAQNLYRRGFSPKEAAAILERDEETIAAWYKKWSGLR